MESSSLPPASPAEPSAAPAADAAAREQIFHHFQEFERNFHRDHFSLWIGTLIGPWIVTAVLGVVVYVVCGPEFTRSLLAAGAIAFIFAGRFIILMEGVGDWGHMLTPEHMFWLVTYQDVMVALFMAFHVGFLFRLPKIGPKIAELIVDGELILSVQPWMRRLTFAGLVAFIAFPLAATGSVGGAIFGRLLGLSRWATFWGSVIGAVIGNGAMWYLSKKVNDYLPSDSWTVKWGGLLIIVGIIVFLERRYSAMKREFLKGRGAADVPPPTAPPPA